MMILLAFLMLLPACQPKSSMEKISGETMGSTYQIEYIHHANALSASDLKTQIEIFLTQLDAQVSTYRVDSDVTIFNQKRAGACQEMSSAVLEMVRTGELLSHQSQGAYDLTIGSLLDLWRGDQKAELRVLPSENDVKIARALCGYQHLHIKAGNTLCKDIALSLNFNSLASGYAIDQIAAFLDSQGIKSYLIEMTGEIRALGYKIDGTPWRVAIEVPNEGQRQSLMVLKLSDHSMSTSGDYRAYYEVDGNHYSHIIDPRSGTPINHIVAAVTVIHNSAMQADALSTLLLVLGEEDGMEFAERHHIAALFVMRSEGSFYMRQSTTFERQLKRISVTQ